MMTKGLPSEELHRRIAVFLHTPEAAHAVSSVLDADLTDPRMTERGTTTKTGGHPNQIGLRRVPKGELQ